MRLFWHSFILWFAFYQRYLKYFSNRFQLFVKCVQPYENGGEHLLPAVFIVWVFVSADCLP